MRNDFESNYLAHHGILGQKWGVRRYQNPDGSLTAAGRARYDVGEGKGVSDISSERGIKRRTKDVNKAIKIINKKRGKEYTKIANNPENFLGLNKKHAKKIDEYSENIKKGKAELDELSKKEPVKKLSRKEAQQEFTALKQQLAETKYKAELHKREAEDAKEHPFKYEISAKSISKQANEEAKRVTEYEKKIDDILSQYGNMKIDNSKSQKKLNEVAKWYEDELKKMK